MAISTITNSINTPTKNSIQDDNNLLTMVNKVKLNTDIQKNKPIAVLMGVHDTIIPETEALVRIYEKIIPDFRPLAKDPEKVDILLTQLRNRTLVLHDINEIAQELGQQAGLNINDIKNAAKEEYNKYLEKGKSIIPTAKFFLKTVANMGLPLAFISNDDYEIINEQIKKHKILSNFPSVTEGIKNYQDKKPSILMYERALRSLNYAIDGIDKENTHLYVIGNRAIDILAAQNLQRRDWKNVHAFKIKIANDEKFSPEEKKQLEKFDYRQVNDFRDILPHIFKTVSEIEEKQKQDTEKEQAVKEAMPPAFTSNISTFLNYDRSRIGSLRAYDDTTIS
jgi:phosphoglycolate phosphatase-like HAD superfamily hydrolase